MNQMREFAQHEALALEVKIVHHTVMQYQH
jgi:hypothetical protein